MRDAKTELEAQRREVASLCDAVAGQYASFELDRAQLSQELEAYEQVTAGIDSARVFHRQ